MTLEPFVFEKWGKDNMGVKKTYIKKKKKTFQNFTGKSTQCCRNLARIESSNDEELGPPSSKWKGICLTATSENIFSFIFLFLILFIGELVLMYVTVVIIKIF